MRYVLTAPYDWWGGTEKFSSTSYYVDPDTNKFKINLIPIRAGHNTVNPKLRGVTIRCANCAFTVRHGDYSWDNGIL